MYRIESIEKKTGPLGVDWDKHSQKLPTTSRHHPSIQPTTSCVCHTTAPKRPKLAPTWSKVGSQAPNRGNSLNMAPTQPKRALTRMAIFETLA